ncbi:MAG: hypothetical protein KDI15_11840 [Thiothrix sp.]|nr:hypothetical protein [Thiothrix sp.]HPE59493.1 J domain-containing protein [Thiolinea sp.]
MNNPYLILGLPEYLPENPLDETGLDDATVKSAYLQQLRRYPPEQHPQVFQQIRRAYEQLETRQKRLQQALFDTTLPNRQDVVTALMPRNPPARPTLQQVQQLLAQG